MVVDGGCFPFRGGIFGGFSVFGFVCGVFNIIFRQVDDFGDQGFGFFLNRLACGFQIGQFRELIRLVSQVKKRLLEFIKRRIFRGFGDSDIGFALVLIFGRFLLGIREKIGSHAEGLIVDVLVDADPGGDAAGTVFVQLDAEVFMNTAGQKGEKGQRGKDQNGNAFHFLSSKKR